MNLLVDIGNTRAKVALWEDGRIVERKVFSSFGAERASEILARFPSITNAVVSSTRDRDEELCAFLRANLSKVLIMTGATSTWLNDGRPMPEALGTDRLAAAAGATMLFPHRNLLVVDFGTAITIDFVSATGEYNAGNISVGVAARFEALHGKTAKLPLTDLGQTPEGLFGWNTEEEMAAGVAYGIAFEIEGYMDRLKADYPDLQTIFTGGDAFFFEKRVKNTIFAESDLIFIGLNGILEYNEC